MLFTPLILGAAAIYVLVYGTRRTIETHFVTDDDRPVGLGGGRASTGDLVDTSHRMSRNDPPTHEFLMQT